MKNAITTLRIQNFKSIKDVEMKPRRVNIIIGEPNVGKSNILEAMSLLGGMVYDRGQKFMNGMVRYERASQLFYDNLSINTIRVETDQGVCILGATDWKGTFQALYVDSRAWHSYTGRYAEDMNESTDSANVLQKVMYSFDRMEPSKPLLDEPYDKEGFGWRSINEDGSAPGKRHGFDKSSPYLSKNIFVRPYLFLRGEEVGQDYGSPFLMPPHGANLKTIIQTYRPLREEVAAIFARYGLKLSLRMVSDELEIIKEDGGLIYSYPYSSTADTLQRLIFYLAAIESNTDSVLLFEEPEAHSYPEYVAQLGQRIVENRDNQFFVVTHSPYLITEILEEMLTDDELTPELAMFVAYYEDYQTKVRQLSEEEIVAIRADGLDVFYNMARFVPGPDNQL